MPQVPVYGGPQIERGQLRTPMQGNIDVSSGTQALARGLGQVADVVEAGARRDAEAEANSLDAQLTGEWNQWNAEARRKYQGANVGEYEAEAAKWWETASSRTGNVSPLAQRRLQDVLQRRRIDALGGVAVYTNAEKDRHADQAAEAASIAAAEMGVDSGNVAGARQDILKITAQQAARKGWTPEQLQVEQQRRVGSMHLAYFTKMVEVDAERARVYYETNKDEIPLAAQGNVEKVLKGEGDNQFASKFAAQNAGKPLAEQISAAGEIKDPERREKALQQIRLNHALVKEAQAEREAAASDTAWQLASQGRRVPELTLSQMNGKERAQLKDWLREKAKQAAEGTSVKTDWATYIDLRERLANGENVNLTPYTTKIAGAQIEQLLDIKTKAKKPGEQDSMLTDEQRIGQATLGLGIDKKKHPEEYASFVTEVDRRVRAESAARGGKNLTADEKQKVIDGIVLDKVYVDEWGRDPHKPVTMFTPEQLKDAYVEVDGRNFKLSSIPRPDREEITRKIRAAGKLPTEQLIAEYFVRTQKRAQPTVPGQERVTSVPQAMQTPK